MDLATLLGIIFGLLCIVVPVSLGGSPFAFVDIQSILVVLGGGIASTLISYRLPEITKVMKVVANAFSGKETSPESTIKMFIDLSQKARRDGLLALESSFEQIEDTYIKEALQLVVDGIEPEAIKDFMSLELNNMRMRHSKGHGLFKTMGALFPAWGMIGTLMGLIKLLGALDDPSTIGPAMAVALITTFYGSVIANFVCIPIANKLKVKSEEELKLKEMSIEGILSIQAGENPKIMEHKLKLFISPERRAVFSSEEKDDDSEKAES